MHVYGWPITSKVASYGWNRRRTAEGFRAQDGFAGRDKEARRGPPEQTNISQKTFVEAVKINREKEDSLTGTGSGQKEVSMFWSRHQREEIWLRSCAMGTLKSFTNVDCVNERLNNRGFQFSSHFMGSKFVLWRFESEIDKEGFINNRFFWEDRFASMRNWSDTPIPNMRLVWISCTGEELVSTNVKVDVGNGSFTVRVIEKATQVDGKWVEQYLGLQTMVKQVSYNHSRRNFPCEEDDRETVGVKLGSRWQERGMDCEDQEVTKGETRCRDKGRKVVERKKKETDISSMDMSEFEFSFSNLHRKNNRGKGKKKCVPKKRKTVQRESLGKLWIGGEKCQRGRVEVSDSTSTSVEEGLLLNNRKWKGECSRQLPDKRGGKLKEFLNNLELGVGQGAYENMSGLQKAIVSRSQSLDGPLKEYLENIEQAFIKAKFLKGLSLQATQSEETALVPNTISPNNWGGCSLSKSVSVVQETIASTDCDSSAAEEDEDGRSSKSVSVVSEGAEEESKSNAKRGRKSQICASRKKANSTTNRGEVAVKGGGFIEEEVVKVLEIGAQLGINFNGKEKEMADFIRRREKEEADRFGQNDGQ
ncbi:hypothetical protein Q3G72_023611 [Acer saccharum]|nr:hypothetical protein Q3G72_023611 [Acer saccharum]